MNVTVNPLCSCGLERLIHTTQQAKIKQLKRVQLLKAQTQQKAHQQTHHQEKEGLEETRAQAVDTRLAKLRAERNEREASVEV